MKAKDLVGKLVTSNYLESRRIFPSGATFKVVGYECDSNWAIIGADYCFCRFNLTGSPTQATRQTYLAKTRYGFINFLGE